MLYNYFFFIRATEFDDTEEEIRKIAGSEFAGLYLQGPKKTWDTSKLYDHIILERLVLDMTPRADKHPLKPSQGGRRAAIAVSGDGMLDFSSSLVSLIRDKDAESEVVPSESDFQSISEVERSETSVEEESSPKKIIRTNYWLRLHSKSHRLVGTRFL